MKTFPKPLSASEEAYYLNQYQEGSLEAKNVLIERNLRLVAHIVKKYPFAAEDTEDLISVGTIGLIKAISTFNSQKNCRLATYAARCIDNELLMFFRNRKKHTKNVSLYEPIGTDKEGNEINIMEIFVSDEADIFDKVTLNEDTKKLYSLLPKILTEREKYVISLRYGLYNQKVRTQQEIAEELGISRSYVSRIEKNALKKLRGEF
ncbi:MAG: RNA polymerase sporulation sigma factor SigK [Lachnospiraceae bacterium]|nr:RNA polymerase sporulation sigma factor SigK [Lachnospiraceae bacterium]